MQNKSVNSNDLSAFGLVESGSPAFVRPMWQNLMNCRARLRGLIKSFSHIKACIFFSLLSPAGSCRSKGWRGTSRSSWSSGKFPAVWEPKRIWQKRENFLSSSIFDLCYWLLCSLLQCISCFTEGCGCQAPAGGTGRGSFRIASIYRSSLQGRLWRFPLTILARWQEVWTRNLGCFIHEYILLLQIKIGESVAKDGKEKDLIQHHGKFIKLTKFKCGCPWLPLKCRILTSKSKFSRDCVITLKCTIFTLTGDIFAWITERFPLFAALGSRWHLAALLLECH